MSAVEYYVTDPALRPLLKAVTMDRERYGADTGAFLDGWAGDEWEHHKGITSLIGPVRPKRIIDELPPGSVKRNAGEMLSPLRGTAVHDMLERSTKACGGRSEERLGRVYTSPQTGAKWLIHHAFDSFYEGNYVDWKNTTSISLQFDKKEWEAELNYAASLLEDDGEKVDRISVAALIEDWRPSKVQQKGMPEMATVLIEIPKWTREELDAFVLRRIVAHEAEGLPECSDEERWVRDKGYKVYGLKKDGSPSSRAATAEVFTSEDGALQWAEENGVLVYRVAHLQSKPIKCLYYCDASGFCEQYKRLSE